jgi:hypothetical protein
MTGNTMTNKCDFPFWLPLWYLQTFLVGHCISCHVIYRSDYAFDIFRLFLLVIVFPVMWYTVLITPLISSNFSCWSLYFLSCDIPFWLPLWYLQTFLVGHCISCHVVYSSDYPFDIFNFPFGHCIACHVIYRSETNKKSLKISKG